MLRSRTVELQLSRCFHSLGVAVAMICLLLVMLVAPVWSQERLLTPSWSSVTVGVADLDQALELWTGVFGFSQLALLESEDPELSTLWNILPTDIQRQALLGLPGSTSGRLHLVQFSEPGPAVREGARAVDTSPHSLIVYARDLPARVKEMQALGYTFFTSEAAELTAADGSRLREIRLLAHDEVGVVLREPLEPDTNRSEESFTSKGFSGITGLINSVEFALTEQAFYTAILGLDLLGEQKNLEGEETERLLGLPLGTAVDISQWGEADSGLGQLELVDYHNVRGQSLYPVTVPTQLGILHVSYPASDLAALQQKLHEAGISHNDREYREVLTGSGRFIRFRTPAGFNIEAYQR